jgi:hypothetical protein
VDVLEHAGLARRLLRPRSTQPLPGKTRRMIREDMSCPATKPEKTCIAQRPNLWMCALTILQRSITCLVTSTLYGIPCFVTFLAKREQDVSERASAFAHAPVRRRTYEASQPHPRGMRLLVCSDFARSLKTTVVR